MRPLRASLLFSLVLLAVGSCSLTLPNRINSQPELKSISNANHIFNAIHSSMRQFGSSLNHNGMSLFIASVPAHTQLYHGTYTPHRINGTEWLAFEPEHAMLFARPLRGGRGPPRREPAFVEQQNPLTAPDDLASGYMHTYRTRHPLRLLYFDGQSAAKSDKGTLEVQDKVLLGNDTPSDDDPGMGSEYRRAEQLCDMARERWAGRIDGFLRMEGGFEIILCDFAKHLDVVQILHARPEIPRGDDRPPRSDAADERFNYYQAVAAWYDGIGGGRVLLDYEHFGTLFAAPDAFYFDDTGRPRVGNDSNSVSKMRAQITDMVMRNSSEDTNAVNWQAVTDMIIARYANRIEYLASGVLETLDLFKDEVDRALRPFIDYGFRNTTLEAHRCVLQFWPAGANSSTIGARSINDVMTTIYSTLLSLVEEREYSTALARAQALKKYLAWTTWKRCKGCGLHEVCFLPIWPGGSEEDFEQPICRTNASSGYWGRF